MRGFSSSRPRSNRLVITPDHRYFVGGREVPGNTAILRASGYGHGYGTPTDLVRGKHVHEAARLFDLGRLDWTTVSETIGPYVTGWAAFRRVSGFVPKLVEVPLFCKRHGFATRPDRVGILNKRWAVVQIKTGSADQSVGLQTAGEALAAEEQLHRPLERFVVVLSGNGWFSLKPLTSRADRPAFLAALATWNRRRQLGWNGRT
jgi:hypothetical protein